jgi:hypothetical protein
MTIIDCTRVRDYIENEVKRKVDYLKKNHKRLPSLCVIMVGDNPASESYVRSKKKACERVGIEFYLEKFEDGTSVSYNDLANIPANLSFDVNLKDLLEGEGLTFIQQFFRFINNYKVKSNVSKSVMKDIIKEGAFDVSDIAHIEQNQSIIIK